MIRYYCGKKYYYNERKLKRRKSKFELLSVIVEKPLTDLFLDGIWGKELYVFYHPLELVELLSKIFTKKEIKKIVGKNTEFVYIGRYPHRCDFPPEHWGEIWLYVDDKPYKKILRSY